ncbi:MAG: oxygen-insensitive NAD(P)H nitroreductase [Telluria sp.]
MDILSAARKRYTAKAYDPTRIIPAETMQQICEVLRLSPSSVNSQPWHFIVASTPEAKQRLAKGVQGQYSYNEPKVLQASHVILLCTRVDTEGGHLDRILAQEDRDGRFKDAAARAGQAKGRLGYMNQHRYALKDLPQWFEKQVYIALGNAMLAAAALGVDSTPMEGLDPVALDAELGLHEKGLSSLVLLSLGYHADSDFNASLPKSRLAEEQVFTFL